jgi:RNA polymerase sigma-70 factor (ECF subfamily)
MRRHGQLNSPSDPAEASELHEQVSKAYIDWRDDVYRYLLTLGLHPPQAQEATQEVFLRLYVTLRKKEEAIRNQRAWVFRVAHNVGLTIRSKERESVPFEAELEATLADRDRGPESGLIEREKLLRMHRAVESLSPQQRQCLHLRAEGLRYREIADAIGVSISTVSEFLRRAVARIKKAVYE